MSVIVNDSDGLDWAQFTVSLQIPTTHQEQHNI